jgi:hypothetical protein
MLLRRWLTYSVRQAAGRGRVIFRAARIGWQAREGCERTPLAIQFSIGAVSDGNTVQASITNDTDVCAMIIGIVEVGGVESAWCSDDIGSSIVVWRRS